MSFYPGFELATLRFEVQNLNHSATPTTDKKAKSIGSIDALEVPVSSPKEFARPLLLKIPYYMKLYMKPPLYESPTIKNF